MNNPQPKLLNIKNICPQELYKCNIKDQHKYAVEIKNFLAKYYNDHPHHQKNMQNCELFVALCANYSLQKTSLLIDIGHQANAFRVICGEGDAIKKHHLNKSFFPPLLHFYENSFFHHDGGHGGTALSIAIGEAKASYLNHKNKNIIVVIGDNSFSNEVNLAALNNLSATPLPITIFLIVNGEGIGKYQDSYLNIFNNNHHLASFCEQMGVSFIGESSGSDLTKINLLIQNSTAIGKSKLIKIVNQTPQSLVKNNATPYYWDETIAKTLLHAVHWKKFIVCVPGMKERIGLSSFASQFPAFYLEANMNEMFATSAIAGIAKMNIKPILLIYSTFLTRGIDLIINDVIRRHLSVLLIIQRIDICDFEGHSHHGFYDFNILSAFQQVTFFQPFCQEQCIIIIQKYLANSFNNVIALRVSKIKNLPDISKFLIHTNSVSTDYMEILTNHKDKLFTLITYGDHVPILINLLEKNNLLPKINVISICQLWPRPKYTSMTHEIIFFEHLPYNFSVCRMHEQELANFKYKLLFYGPQTLTFTKNNFLAYQNFKKNGYSQFINFLLQKCELTGLKIK